MKKKKTPQIWKPKGFDLTKSYALQAVAEGRADEGQQIEALRYIVENLSGMSYRPEILDNEKETYYNLGAQSVGRAINHIAALNLAAIKELEKK